MALNGRVYRYKPSMTRKPNAHLKWIMPLVAAGQVRQALRGGPLLPGWLFFMHGCTCCGPAGSMSWATRLIISRTSCAPHPVLNHCCTATMCCPQYLLWREVLKPRLDKDLKAEVGSGWVAHASIRSAYEGRRPPHTVV